MTFLTGVFILILASIVGDTIVKLNRARARRDEALGGELEELVGQLRTHTEELADARRRLEGQERHIDELYERLEFAERLLTQVREQQRLPPGDAG